MIYATHVIGFTGLLALAASLPLSEREALDVWAPPITFPTAGYEACIGHDLDVKWDTSDPPAQITNPMGTLYFVQNKLLDTDHPAASKFPLSDGHVTFTIPTSKPSGTYQLALVGDSGNWSPLFQLVHCHTRHQ